MKVKGLNKAYEVEIEKMMVDGKEAIVVTTGTWMINMTSVAISKEDWEKLKGVI